MQRIFQFIIPWEEASKKLIEVRECEIPYEVDSVLSGMVVIYLPDLPHRVYNRVRAIFNSDGIVRCCFIIPCRRISIAFFLNSKLKY